MKKPVFLLGCLFLAFPAWAQIVLDSKQMGMLKAAQSVQRRDYAAALAAYDRVLAQDGAFVPAYIQRSVVKREMKDEVGSKADASMAVRLAEASLAREPQNPRLYYQRGQAYRLLGDYAKARENVRYAMQLPGADATWNTELQAIDIEEKFYK